MGQLAIRKHFPQAGTGDGGLRHFPCSVSGIFSVTFWPGLLAFIRLEKSWVVFRDTAGDSPVSLGF